MHTENPMQPIDPDEAPYIRAQLGRIEAGHPERVHPSTLGSLRRRGYVDGWDRLTDDGIAALAVARSFFARTDP